MCGSAPLLTNQIEPKLPSECRKQSLSSESLLSCTRSAALPILREFWENDNLYCHLRSQSLPSRTTQPPHEDPRHKDEGPNLAALPPYCDHLWGNTILLMPEAQERRFSFLASDSRDPTAKSLHRNVPASCPSYCWPTVVAVSPSLLEGFQQLTCQITRQRRLQTTGTRYFQERDQTEWPKAVGKLRQD